MKKLTNTRSTVFRRKLSAGKLKGWICGAVVALLLGAGILASPAAEATYDNQAVRTEAESVQKELLTVAAEEEESAVSEIEVHFIDVGQGDATLIKSDGHYMLIDAGDNDKGTAVQLYLQKQGVEKLDYLVLTHTDADHIGGADVVITKFDIDTVFLGDFKKDNKTYEELMNALEYKGLSYLVPAAGSEYQLGSATFTIAAPNGVYEDPNNSSIALVLRNGDNSFLFTGDCEERAESDILSNGLNIDCDVYKVGHHGSKTASSQDFLNAVTPIYGVISCAEGNSYGHPHAETLNNLRAMGVQVFRTDEQGSIIAYSDGTDITWNCAPSGTWQAGEATATSATEPAQAPIPTAETAPEPTQKPSLAVEPAIAPAVEPTPEPEAEVQQNSIIANKNTEAFHRSGCSRLPKEKNRVYFNSREEALAAGYGNPCDFCNP